MSAPKYSPLGALLCSACGSQIETAVTQKGDTMARCENPECQNTQTYEIGSFRHNPAPGERAPANPFRNDYRYIWGQPNWQVKDGHKIEETQKR